MKYDYTVIQDGITYNAGEQLASIISEQKLLG